MKKAALQTLFILNLAIIGYFWFLRSGPLLLNSSSGAFIALGRLFGLLAEYFILLQLILIGRIRWIEQQFGHDKMNRLHRTVGLWLSALIIVHPLALTVGYAKALDVGLIPQFLSFLNDWEDVLNAFIGLIIFILAIALSLTVVRKKLKYERWHFVHFFMYAAIALAFGHQINTASVSRGTALYYWLALNCIVFGLVLFYRFLRPFYLFSKFRFKISRIEPETSDITSIYIEGRNIDQFKFEAGQFAILNFLSKGLWESHPFSISCAPNGKYLRFSIKALGDFTKRIRELKPGTSVIIDGPLGVFTERSSHKDKYLFMAGGIGITPIMSLLDSMSPKNKDIVLLYSSRQMDQIPFRNRLLELPIHQYFIISDEVNLTENEKIKKGRIDRERITSLVPDFLDREIFVCGPPAMSEALFKTCKELGVPPKNIHYERFAF